MTTQEVTDYYAKLLIIQYSGKPKAYATIQALVKMVVMDQLPTQVQDAFDIDTAVGVQLDVIGKYAGVVRDGYSFIGNPISLSDADFRVLIKFAVAVNSAGSSLSDIQTLLDTFFPNQILVFDYANMQMSYLIDSDLGSPDLVQMIVSQNLLPRPMTVQLAGVIYAPDITHFFGFRTYLLAAYHTTPFNSYTSYDTNAPWLSYSDSI